MTLKRIFAVLACTLVLVGCFSVSAFAYVAEGDTEDIDAGNEVVANPGGTTVSYSLNSEYQVFKVQINSKAQGAFGVTTSTYDYLHDIPTPYRIEFSIEFPEEYIRNRQSPRFYVWYGYSRSTLVGYSISFEDIGIHSAVVNSYTLNYNTTETALLDDNYIYDLDYYWRFFIEVDPNTSTSSLYFAPEGLSPILLNVNENITEFDNGVFGLGMFDAWSANNKPIGLYIPSITNLGVGYAKGYAEGLRIGENIGYARGKTDGIALGKIEGFDKGYDAGKSDGEVSEIAVPEVISTVMNSTVTLFRNIFGFELFGINISALIGSLTLVIVIAWIIRKAVR